MSSHSHFPGPPVLVLDVNGVLCRKVFDNKRTLQARADGYTPSGLALFKRPGVGEVIDSLLSDGWRIVLWSSAIRTTVDAARRVLLPHVRPIVIFSHENSPVDTRHPVIRANKNWAILKDLRLLWRVPTLQCDATNTVIVDDSWSKVRLHPENAVLVPSFVVDTATGIVTEDQARREVEAMQQLKDLLTRAARARDVRDVLREHARYVHSIRLGAVAGEESGGDASCAVKEGDVVHVAAIHGADMERRVTDEEME